MNPDGQMRLSDSVMLYGICEEMCPEYERVRRIFEQDVKAPECTPETQHLSSRNDRVPDESRMVKAYARSAAGMDVELVSEIRSPATCLRTLNYLYGRLDTDDFVFLYSWLWDRTRAVRKDLRTQRIEKSANINLLLTCLERSARFYMLSAHHMGRSNKDDYSHQQDVEQLNQTLISLNERYADNRRASIISQNEAEFWAYRLILAPIYANTQLENELHRLPSDLRNNPRVKTALEIFRVLKAIIIFPWETYHQCQSNWKKFWDLIKSPRVSYLMACAAAISFNKVRHIVLDSLWRTFRQGLFRHNVKVEGWTPSRLREALGFDTEKEAVAFCEAHGFSFEKHEAGHTFMDIRQKHYELKKDVLPKADVKPQFFSATIVEPKRYGRALSAVIQGLSVQEAKRGGLGMQAQQTEDETSLFVPESSSVFGRQSAAKTPAFGGFGINPTASPFQPSGTPTAAGNPFLKAAQPGIFDPYKNPIKFAPSTDANANPFLQYNGVTPPAAPVNPFLKNGNTAPTQSTTPSTPNPFLPGSFAAPQVSTPKPEQPTTTATSTPKPAPAFSFPGPAFNTAPSQGTPLSGLSFTPTGPPPQPDTSSQEAEKLKAEQDQREAAEKQQREAEARKRVQEAQKAAQEMKQKQENERRRQADAAAAEQRRLQQEQEDRERKVREEQERLVQQARQRQAQEEAARTARIQEKESALHALTSDVMFNPDEGLLLQFIENAVINISKEAAKAVEMEKRVAYADKKYEAYLVGLKRAGLAKMMLAVEKKKRNQKVRERRKRLKEQRARMAEMQEEQTEAPAPVQPVQPVQTTTQSSVHSKSQRSVAPPNARRAKRTEERHRAQAAETNGGTDSGSISNSSGPQVAVQSTANGNSMAVGYSQSYRKAASIAPVDRTETDWFRLRAKGIDPSKHRKRSFDFTSSDEEKPKLIEAKRPKLSPPATESQEPTPPRTELDEQRARLEAVKQGFRRSETSPSQSVNGTLSVSGRSSFHDSTNSVIARARAMLASSKAEMPPPPYVNGTSSLNRSDSFDANVSLLIARAKGIVPRNDTTPNVQHDWSRSVPNLGFSASQSQQPTGSSTASTKDRPAYWDRVSRFVPRHLYGKGAEAVRAYRIEQGLSKSPASTRPASTEPLALSSPIPAMQSYVQPPQSYAQSYMQEQYSEIDDAASSVDIIDVDADAEDEDENAIEEELQYDAPSYANESKPYYNSTQQLDDEDADSEMLDDEELVEYDDEEEDLASDEEVPESYDETEEENDDDFAQPVQQQWGQPSPNKSGGATQDDAIELSD
jgi:hypothetical protein